MTHAKAFAVSFGWTLAFGLAGLALYLIDDVMFRTVFTSAMIGVRQGFDYVR
jgi:hypothetical protein